MPIGARNSRTACPGDFRTSEVVWLELETGMTVLACIEGGRPAWTGTRRRSSRSAEGARWPSAGDGQVTLGTQVMKADAVKVRKLLEGQVLVGFAGSAADGFALLERFEGKLKDYPNNVPRAATELAKLWRTDRMLRRLEAVLARRRFAAQPARERLGRRDPAQRRHPGHGLGRRLRPGGGPGAPGAFRPLGRRDRPRVAD